MNKIQDYRNILACLPDWEEFLIKNSGLPGPRGNLELAEAVAISGKREYFQQLISTDNKKINTNCPEVFLVFCGIVGLGKVITAEETQLIALIKNYAADPRWRIREAVAMSLQQWGKKDMPALLAEMETWVHERPYIQRAVAAGLCEPALLRQPENTRRVLAALDEITAGYQAAQQSHPKDEVETLRKGLCYCWSVAAAALPEAGLPLMEKWLQSGQTGVRHIMKDNLDKKRLIRVAPDWVSVWKKR